jgi:5-methyltetrahydropteroyltriglutamate--homocysteine methyltransferase
MSIIVSTLGFPRIGPRRELKTSLERYWSGRSDSATLLQDAGALRAANWARQHALGITHIPSNDFSLYDHVLDASVMVGAIPKIYGWRGGDVPIETYFAMARGTSAAGGHDDSVGSAAPAHGLPALEMTKWFDTNYHYMVPELSHDPPSRCRRSANSPP